MTGESVDCFNCGRSNPEWAQVCRSCGVPLRHGAAVVGPTGRFPTDRGSLTSIGAVIGTILLAVLLGIFLSTLNPVDPTVGEKNVVTPTPSPTAEPSASETPIPTETPVPTPTATPGPAGTLTFGEELDGNDQVDRPVETFTPGMTFAHSITVPQPFGVSSIGEQVLRIDEASGAEEEVQRAFDNQLSVPADATSVGFETAASNLLAAYEQPGLYEMRVFAGDTLIAVGRFRLSEG